MAFQHFFVSRKMSILLSKFLLIFLWVGVLVCIPAQAAEYNISVVVDDTTKGDLDLIATAASSAADGTEVSKSLRRLVMAAVGEVHVLFNKRFDPRFGNLLLDNASTVTVSNGDSIIIRPPNSCLGGGACVSLGFQCAIDTNTGRKNCDPWFVQVVTSSQMCVGLNIPPTTVTVTVGQCGGTSW